MAIARGFRASVVFFCHLGSCSDGAPLSLCWHAAEIPRIRDRKHLPAVRPWVVRLRSAIACWIDCVPRCINRNVVSQPLIENMAATLKREEFRVVPKSPSGEGEGQW